MIWLFHILAILFFIPGLIITIPLHIILSAGNDIKKYAEKVERKKEMNDLKEEIRNLKRNNHEECDDKYTDMKPIKEFRKEFSTYYEDDNLQDLQERINKKNQELYEKHPCT